MKINMFPCDRCKKKTIDPLKTRTLIKFANYQVLDANLALGLKTKVLCKDCSDKLKKWLKK